MACLAKRPVLVLNRSWVPLRVTNLEYALTKLNSESEGGKPKALVIDPSDYQVYTWEQWSELRPQSDDEVIRGVRKQYRVPEVILVHYDKPPYRYGVKFSRRMIYHRDNNQCQYCGKYLDSTLLNIDHVIPRSRGGQTTWENVVLSCIKCNSKKADKTPKEAGMKLMREPTKPKFGLLRGEKRSYPKSFEKFMSEIYWDVPLERD